MAENINPNGNTPELHLVTRGNLLWLPERSKQASDRALIVADALIKSPSLLPSFLHAAEGEYSIAEALGDESRRGELTGFLSRIHQSTTKFNWASLETMPLSPDHDSALGLMDSLSMISPIGKTKRPYHERIVEQVVRGYVNDRFDSGGRANWMGALNTSYELVDAVVSTDDKPGMFAWLQLALGEYGDVSPQGSLYWRSIYDGVRAVDPRAEAFFAVGLTISKLITRLGVVFDKQPDVVANSNAYSYLNVQFTAAQSAMLAREDLRTGNLIPGVDIRSSEGKRLYRGSLDAMKNPTPELAASLKQSGITLADIQKAITLPLHEDTVSIAAGFVRYPQRAIPVIDYLNTGFTNLSEGRWGGQVASDLNNILDRQFPFGFIAYQTDLERKVTQLIDPSVRRDQLEQTAQENLTKKGDGWVLVKFNFQGFNGYAIVPEVDVPKSQKSAVYIDTLIGETGLTKEDIKEMLSSRVGTGQAIIYQGREIYFNKDDAGLKTALESLLEMNVPVEKLDDALKRMRKNLELSRNIPERFTRMPTSSGDKYLLLEHPDLPGVLSKAVIKKASDGGLIYTLEFVSDKLIYPDGKKPITSGKIRFDRKRVTIGYDEQVLGLPVDQRILIENVLLNLVERSCCPDLAEIEREREDYKKVGLKDVPIPGYVGHVGGYRGDGTRKQFTLDADTNYAKAMKELFGESHGISLADVNRRHRELLASRGEADDRFVTYYAGRDATAFREPITRSNPDAILSRID